jgi:hypothetical protein
MSFARRFVTTMAFGPFLIVTFLSLVAGRLPVLLWGYPLWSFLPLAVIAWCGPVTDARRLRAFAAWFIVLFVSMPILFVSVPHVEALIRDRTRAVDFPGEAAAEALTRIWREKTESPLVYVSGDELAANSIAVYSHDRPRVVVHGVLQYSPWIDVDDLRRRGALIVWTDGGSGRAFIPIWKHNFPGFDPENSSVIELPMQSLRTKTLRLRYVIVPPRP